MTHISSLIRFDALIQSLRGAPCTADASSPTGNGQLSSSSPSAHNLLILFHLQQAERAGLPQYPPQACRLVCVCPFLSGGRGRCDVMWPCAGIPCVLTVPSAPPTPARPALAKPHCLRASRDSAVPSLLPSVAPSAARPAVPKSPMAVLCSFSLSSHRSQQCCVPEPGTEERPGACPGGEPFQKGRRSRGTAGLRGSVPRGSCGRTADDRGEPTLASWLGACPCPSPPAPCHVVEVIIPANLQTEHFDNLHREQTAI